MGSREPVWHNTFMNINDFQLLVWDYYHDHGRDLPWRQTQDPYAIFISEVMLQQTQVARVLTQFPLFMAQFPDFATLASSATSDVLIRWQGMGYNRRALWLKRAAEKVITDFGGQLPRDPKILATLPGIGPNTAGSIAAFAFNQPTVFIETNIRRTFIYHFFSPSSRPQWRDLDMNSQIDPSATLRMTNAGVSDQEILPLIKESLNRENPREWYWALMDYGANLVKTTPNPNRRSKHYAKHSKFEGSKRQLRAEVLRQLIGGPLPADELQNGFNHKSYDIIAILSELIGEGFLINDRGNYRLVE